MNANGFSLRYAIEHGDEGGKQAAIAQMIRDLGGYDANTIRADGDAALYLIGCLVEALRTGTP